MNKFEKTYKRTEEVMLSRNSMLLSFVLLKLKDAKIEPDINSIIINYIKLSPADKSAVNRELLSKVDKGFLYKRLLFLSSNALYNNDFESLKNIFLSYKDLGLIADASVLLQDKENSIELTMPNGGIVKYSPLGYLSSTDLDTFRGSCHEVVSYLMKRDENKDNELAVVLEPYLFGGPIYHSFMISDEIIIDFAHNIAIRYDDYIALVKPDVLVREKCQTAVNEIVDLRITDSEFYTCNFIDVLKYGIEKQLERKAGYMKKYHVRKCDF